MIVPFADAVGLKDDVLEHTEHLLNHVGSIHAGAQFTFAEHASGQYLASLFSKMKGEFVPLLREARVKYKKQALSSLRSEVYVDDEMLEKFITSYEKKGRGTIVAEVTLFDTDGDVTCIGAFKWFVQKV